MIQKQYHFKSSLYMKDEQKEEKQNLYTKCKNNANYIQKRIT